MNIDNWTFDDLIEAVQLFKLEEDSKKGNNLSLPCTLNDENNWEDVVQREFATCKRIQDQPTKLNFKKVTIKVTSFNIVKGGFFSSDFANFQVETDIQGEKEKSKVPRKDVDFYTLRRLLKQQFPHMLIPPLPVKNGSLQEKVLQKRKSKF